MKREDAAKILGLSGIITPDITKKAYYTAAKKFHPDINPAGLEMMKIVNAAFEALKDFEGTIGEPAAQHNGREYPDALNDALNAIIGTPLDIEICGAWVWISGATYGYRETLKASGFKWAAKKQQWYFRPDDWKSASRGSMSMDAIRETYGSERPRKRQAVEEEVTV